MLVSTNSSDHDDGKSLVIVRRNVEVVISEDGVSPFSLVMPPYEDMEEVEALQHKHFSMHEWSVSTNGPVIASLRYERSRLEKKSSHFGSSSTFLNRLANLASVTGDLEDEADYLSKAVELDRDDFFSNRQIENLLARHLDDDARRLLLTKDLSTNLYANLRLATMHALRNEVSVASNYVDAALVIDPLDFGARLFEGALNIWNGQYDRAVLSFRIASERRPNSASLHTNLAVAYIKLGRRDKAIKSLKMAVAIDPFSLNALTLLADLANALDQSEDAIPSLRYYLRFEQKQHGVWARLARALLKIGETSEAIAATKRQASLIDDSDSWNNLGIAYYAKGDLQKAVESFKHAMELSKTTETDAYCLAARNFASVIARRLPASDVIRFIDETVTDSNAARFAARPELASIFLIKLNSLIKSRRLSEAATYGEDMMTWVNADADLAPAVATGLMALYSLNEGGSERALQLAREFSDRALNGSFHRSDNRSELLNNIAFVFAENGEVGEAERHLQAISAVIHESPYTVATSGLVHFKKGHFQRASLLYEEALRLCLRAEDKIRIRQKWNLELGKAAIELEPKKAVRYLTKAKNESDGEEGIARQAASILKALSLGATQLPKHIVLPSLQISKDKPEES
jgi:tetratricopeptide (TPR) repeat protein